MSNTSLLLKISGENFHYEQPITDSQRTKIISLLILPENSTEDQTTSSNLPAPSNTSFSTQPHISKAPALSLREFMNDKSPSTIAEKIAVFITYARDFREQRSVDRLSLKKMFVEAQEQIPLNLKRDISKARKQGWIALHPEGKEEYYLTTTGESAVTNGFSKKTSKVRVQRVLPGKKIILTVREKVEKLNLQPTKQYWALNKKDRVLWLLYQAQENDISELNFKEISRLAEKIGDNIESKQMTSLAIGNVQQGRIVNTLSSDHIRMLRALTPGIDYIRNKTLGDVA